LGLLGVLLALGLLIFAAYRGWSILLLAPVCALIAALSANQPLLANWTQTFMRDAARFVGQFFPIFLLGAVFGKLMEATGSVEAIAGYMTRKLGAQRAILAIVLAGAFVTYGGVSLFVAFFVLAPMGHALFRAANIPHRLMPAAIALGTSTFTMSAMPGSPAIQNTIPMPFFGTTVFAAPGLGLIASAIMLGFGLWWLSLAEARARRRGERYVYAGHAVEISAGVLRERATTAREFDPSEITRGAHADKPPPIVIAAAPLVTVVALNLVMSVGVLPGMDAGFLAEPRWGATSLAAVGGVWSVITALAGGILLLIAVNGPRLETLRETMTAGANAAALPILSVASLVGFGAVIAGLPAFEIVKQQLLSIGGGPLVSLAVASNVLGP
jgi:H+/gluconate symporter-like permease